MEDLQAWKTTEKAKQIGGQVYFWGATIQMMAYAAVAYTLNLVDPFDRTDALARGLLDGFDVIINEDLSRCLWALAVAGAFVGFVAGIGRNDGLHIHFRKIESPLMGRLRFLIPAAAASITMSAIMYFGNRSHSRDEEILALIWFVSGIIIFYIPTIFTGSAFYLVAEVYIRRMKEDMARQAQPKTLQDQI